MDRNAAHDITFEAEIGPHLRLIEDPIEVDSQTRVYSKEDLAEIAKHGFSPLYNEIINPQLPFKTIRDTMTQNLPKLRANSLDRKELLQKLEEARTEKNLDKIKGVSIGLSQAESSLDKAKQAMADLINPEAIDRTINQLTIYKDAFRKHLEEIELMIQDPAMKLQDRVHLAQ